MAGQIPFLPLNTHKFFVFFQPKITICTTDYCNRYEHPRDSVRKILYDLKIPIYTTKTGDIIIESTNGHRADYKLTNYQTNGKDIRSISEYVSKKSHFLRQNLDARRNRYLDQSKSSKPKKMLESLAYLDGSSPHFWA